MSSVVYFKQVNEKNMIIMRGIYYASGLPNSFSNACIRLMIKGYVGHILTVLSNFPGAKCRCSLGHSRRPHDAPFMVLFQCNVTLSI